MTATTVREPSTIDRCVGGLGLGLLMLWCLVSGFFGMFVGMVSDGCTGIDRCNDSLIMGGTLIASFGQLAPAAIGLGWFVRRWHRHELVWFVPFVVAVLPILIILVGGAIAQAGVP